MTRGVSREVAAFVLVLGSLIAVGIAARGMLAPIGSTRLAISLSPAALPGYTLRTIARMLAALCASLLFTLEFIEDEFSEKRSSGTWHLHVHTSGGEALGADLQAAIEHYYERLASSARERLRDQIRFGQLALLGGIVIFLASMTARTILASALPAGAPRMLDEGLIVLAWLALWRPAESLVYGWVPLYRERRLYERLAAIRVCRARRGESRAGESARHGPSRRSSRPRVTLTQCCSNLATGSG